MSTAVINIRTNTHLKQEAKKILEEFGLTLTSFINAKLKKLVRSRSIVFSLNKEETLTPWAIKQLKESETDYKKGRISPSFTSAKDAIKWLEPDE
ncbi:type II toxin-antitoxin system RelB/DinJ family antitoxin [Patescibacteria group bacterium]|nr:type II toxin-antitoxin system RelB/DinJ family antitoxin [Patescibacteria group bacterium]MCG2702626.1 type II toxin-antitoxin system RelB/DinJ family antitoxin [Candidatus Parcubacteria bacterium]MBU4210642.1 type II toxin-antitoxin system RelB/DinJ family antitoxin [Patescibacteria group bacterium]MBU4265480.1 type II toxin-antitoxin system RelB/DinJ family antitoxin [Patescibacteria group bacterium]MBU4390530.1 type II toxin-antitoxin system RelB/DinJ family antitoxin [Patescibacteria gr